MTEKKNRKGTIEKSSMSNTVSLRLYDSDGRLKKTSSSSSMSIGKKVAIGILFIPVLLFVLIRGLYRLFKRLV